MSRSPVWRRLRWLIAVGSCLGLGACSLDTDVPHRSDGDALGSAGNGVQLSGADAPDADAVRGPGTDIVISDINSGSSGQASVNPGGIDSGGAPNQSTDGVGGAVTNDGGAADAGGPDQDAHSRGEAGEANGNAGASGANDPPPTLYFSEYVEGSSSYKALEIAAPKRSNLDGCKVGTYFNGKAEATVVATLSGTLEAGHVLTVCSSSLQEKLGAAVCAQVGNLTFNGDDAIAIACNGQILDVIGQPGVDPGTAWGNAANSTADHTLRRKCSVTSGKTSTSTPFDPSVDWQAYPIDTFDGLGKRGC